MEELMLAVARARKDAEDAAWDELRRCTREAATEGHTAVKVKFTSPALTCDFFRGMAGILREGGFRVRAAVVGDDGVPHDLAAFPPRHPKRRRKDTYYASPNKAWVVVEVDWTPEGVTPPKKAICWNLVPEPEEPVGEVRP